MAVPEPNNDRYQKDSLKAQYQQIKWYMENQHYLQAITLMLEWLISYECLRGNYREWLTDGSREEAKNALNERRGNNGNVFAGLNEELQTLNSLWDKCVKIRHDLAHCGMRLNPQNAEDAITGINELFQKFKDFVKEHLP